MNSPCKALCFVFVVFLSLSGTFPSLILGGTFHLEYSTYLGRYDSDNGNSLDIDSEGYVYIFGTTTAYNFPTVNPYQSSLAGKPFYSITDVFISKLSSTGSELIYSTYLGGSDMDFAHRISQVNGAAYICGETQSTDFPTGNPYQSSYAGGYKDVFISKLSSTGSSLIFSTYFGGSASDYRPDMSTENNSIYLCGTTTSADFPIQNAYQSSSDGRDAFVTKLSSSGSIIIYSTYLGGSSFDTGYEMSVENGSAYIVGETSSSDFPTELPYQPSNAGAYDSFASKLSTCGSILIYSTYLGGDFLDFGKIICVENGAAYICGETQSTNFPTENPYQASLSEGCDLFVSKLSNTGSELVYSTYFGGVEAEVIGGIAAQDGFAYLCGGTNSTDFPTWNPYQTSNASEPFAISDRDAFLSKFSSNGSNLVYSTYFGGNDGDTANGIVVKDQSVYICGGTTSLNFPTENPYQAINSEEFCSHGEAFISKLAWIITPTPTPTPTPPSLCSATFQFSNLEDLEIFTPRGSGRYDIVYQLKDVAESISSWGHIFDNDNNFYDGQTGPGDVLLRSYVHAGFSTQTGDILVVTYDGAQWKRVYLPTLTGYTELYVGSDGSTYYDQWLCQTAQEALPPTPTPSPSPPDYKTPTPTPICYRTLPPTPSVSPTPVPCVDCPSTSSESVTLTDQTTSGEFIYDFTKNCRKEPGHLFDWWSSCTDWLAVEPEQGFGFDSQLFELTVSLGDTSFLSQGLHSDWLSFSDNWGGCGTAVMEVRYYKGTPIPTPTITAPPTSSPTPTTTPKPTTSVTPILTPTPSTTFTPTSPTPTPQSLISIIESGDYDGDGTSDIAIFRGDSGLWAVRGITRSYFGASGDLPVSGDYDGDGTADIGIFRGSSGLWVVRNVTRVYYGSSSDIPIPGDYNGDGSCDVGIFRSTGGLWAVTGVTRAYFGASGDLPVPGDYDGDGTKDIALFRGSSGLWAIRNLPRVYYGRASDNVVPGDYDGDGTWEPTIFRPSAGMWAIKGLARIYFGGANDRPVPADFDGSGTDDVGIFRYSSGLWAIRGLTRAYFGAVGDLPVTR